MNKRLLRSKPEIAVAVFIKRKCSLPWYVILPVFGFKAVFFFVIQEQSATIRDGPKPTYPVFVTCHGIIDGIVLVLGIILLEFEFLGTQGAPTYSYNTLIVSGKPDVAGSILRDVSNITVRKIRLPLAHGNTNALIIGIYHAESIALSNPQDLVSCLEDGIHKIVNNERCVLLLQEVGGLALCLDNDAIIVVGKPQFPIFSSTDTGNTRSKRFTIQRRETRDAPII